MRLERKAPLERPLIDKARDRLQFGDLMAAMGWGLTDKTRAAKTLQLAAKLPILGTETCEIVLEEELDEHMICAGGIGMDTCRGKQDRYLSR